MSLFSLNVSERVGNLVELLSASDPIYYWAYTAEGALMESNCSTLLLDKFFRFSGSLDKFIEYGTSHDSPIIVSVPLGLTWCAVFEKEDGVLSTIHVLGPTATEGISRRAISAVLDDSPIPIKNRAKLFHVIEDLSLVPITNSIRFTQMLHFAITGSKLQSADIYYMNYSESNLRTGKKAPPRDRMKTWMQEKALMRMISEGDLNYKDTLSDSAKASTGVKLRGTNSLEQVKITQIVFITISVRAAIEGGLSPETAYSRGDAYIQNVLDSKTISEAAFIGHTMYEDFIRLVHNTQLNPSYSKQIQSCCDYIALHIEEKLTLSEIASRIGYSDYYLSRKFKQETGTSIGDYIKTAKIERAKTLLLSTDKSIQEICDALSFGTRSFFAQTFKDIVGIPPAQYREENQRI